MLGVSFLFMVQVLRQYHYWVWNYDNFPFFPHDMAYGDFKDLTRRTASEKILREKAFNITKNLKYDGYQRGLDLMVYKIFDKKSFLKRKILQTKN